ncbi:SDR family oxidoreductase [Algicella marina]|uniref:SDR family NAD(P)-dependent oxidoreductase n=1 Tax=Algicella marina TaxID=2683284 RepID=A0A6P1T4M7_9RHOB|nr:SDR family oxidoreductase [Algicella marina]QHQ36721.1 SDR family NAD(P)-dependent oxidoreductase [Algicella marina]
MGKIAIVTGAGTGLGAATTRAFLDAGYSVGLLGRRPEPLEDVAAGHAEALVVPTDVSDPDAVDAAFAKVAERFGRLDVVFNNAGMGSPGMPIDETPVETWLNVVNVNLTGAFLVARAAFRQMRAQSPQGGRIINNGSISAYAPRPGSVPYTTTKHGITGLTRTLSLDGRPFNIACGQIDIGNALTEMAMPMTKGVPQADGSIAIEATMDPEHVASSVLYMAGLPLEANVQFMTVMATKMPFVGRG